MKRDGTPVLRSKQSKFIFIQMKGLVNQNGFEVQNIAVKESGSRQSVRSGVLQKPVHERMMTVQSTIPLQCSLIRSKTKKSR